MAAELAFDIDFEWTLANLATPQLRRFQESPQTKNLTHSSAYSSAWSLAVCITGAFLLFVRCDSKQMAWKKEEKIVQGGMGPASCDKATQPLETESRFEGVTRCVRNSCPLFVSSTMRYRYAAADVTRHGFEGRCLGGIFSRQLVGARNEIVISLLFRFRLLPRERNFAVTGLQWRKLFRRARVSLANARITFLGILTFMEIWICVIRGKCTQVDDGARWQSPAKRLLGRPRADNDVTARAHAFAHCVAYRPRLEENEKFQRRVTSIISESGSSGLISTESPNTDFYWLN